MRKLVSIDPTMTGSEPSWADQDSSKNSNVDLIKALNWYNYSFSTKDAKEFVLDYAKSVGRTKDELALIKSIPDNKFNRQLGWIARMMCVGHTPSEKTTKFFTKTYKETLRQATQVAPVQELATASAAPEVSQVTIQQRIVDKSREEAGELEGLLDDFVLSKFKMSIDVENYIKNRKLSSVVLKKICDIFVPKSQHISDVIATKDAQIKEGYSNFSKVELKKMKEFMDSIIATSNKTAEVQKSVRKPRKKKEKPAAVLAAKVAFLAADEETGLKSIHPEKIIGANQVWVYNAKTRTLGVYFSDNAKGLSIKGTTIQNFKEDVSLCKKLRKPQETIKTLMEAGKVKLKQILPSLSTKESQLTGRINSDTMIVRVVN